jgi:quercetin dioxygenase-like cupin family protein
MSVERHTSTHRQADSAAVREPEVLGRRRVITGLLAAAATAALGRGFTHAAFDGDEGRILERDEASSGAGGHEMAQATTVSTVVKDDEATAIWFLGTLALIKGNGPETGGTFGTVEFTHPAGFSTPLHVHHHEDEAFYVLDGTIRGICDGREWSASRGDFVWLPKDSHHGYMVEGEQTVRTLAFSIPAGFEQFVIEAGEPAQSRTLPAPSEPDFEKLGAAAAKYGQEILGPLPL